MKKLLLYVSIASLYINVQAQKSYAKLRSSVTIQGSTRGIVKGMKEAGYGPDIQAWLFGTIHYPKKIKYPALYVEAGLFMVQRKSLSVLMGFENAGRVEGYSTSSGTHVILNYEGYVLSPKFNFHKKATLIGLGPTFMVFKYGDYVDAAQVTKDTKFFPGISVTGEALFKDKRPLSIGVFSTLNLYPGSTMQLVPAHAGIGKGYAAKVSPTNIQAGLIFRIAHT